MHRLLQRCALFLARSVIVATAAVDRLRGNRPRADRILLTMHVARGCVCWFRSMYSMAEGNSDDYAKEACVLHPRHVVRASKRELRRRLR